jgi:hypothetical protein
MTSVNTELAMVELNAPEEIGVRLYDEEPGSRGNGCLRKTGTG